ncbi:MAG: DUF6088 family protein [Verrucomicrobiales bacterium]
MVVSGSLQFFWNGGLLVLVDSGLLLTQKMVTFCVKNQMAKHPSSTETKVLARIKGKGRGWVFTPAHLKDLGTRNAIASALKRLKAEGTIRQLARGLYDFPEQHPILGTIAPSADAVARALVVRDVIRLQPSGAYAANILGLSEQVPARIVFLTDGPTRTVKLGKQEIVLKRTTPRNMATAGKKSGNLIQALRYLGQSNVDEQVIKALKRNIAEEEKTTIQKDLRHAPMWIADILRPLTEPAD